MRWATVVGRGPGQLGRGRRSPSAVDSGVLDALSGRIRSLELGEDNSDLQSLRTRRTTQRVPIGWGDDLLEGGLQRGRVHEWFGLAGLGQRWTPPLCLLSHLARRGLATTSSAPSETHAGGCVVWIGRHVWPYPHLLLRTERLGRGLFIDPPDDATRLWALDVALRSPAVSVVVADGRGLTMADSRRVQLAAEAGTSFALVARPPTEMDVLSAAATRWRVTTAPTNDARPAWRAELCRMKGGSSSLLSATGRRGSGAPPIWRLEWDESEQSEGVITASAEVAGRSDPAPVARTARRHTA